MKLNLREKQTFYHELGRFLQSGIPLTQAVESLAADSRGSMRQVLNALLKLFLGGESVVGAFAALQPTVGSMEVALVEASDRSGRLEQAFNYLAGYFDVLATVRSSIIKRTVWPIVQLHIGVIVLNFVSEFIAAMGGAGFNFAHFFVQVGAALGFFYALIAAAITLGVLLARAGRSNAGIDALLAVVPVIGKLRRDLSLSRFCAAYEMQLAAGVNVMDSVRAAAEASQGARIRSAVGRMVPSLMTGSAVGSLMSGYRVFPNALQRAIRSGEETGSLDADLRRWADYYQKSAVATLEAAGAWLSRIISIMIMLYLGYKIVVTYQTVLQGTYGKILDGV